MHWLYLWDNLKLANHFSGRIDRMAPRSFVEPTRIKNSHGTVRREISNATRVSAASAALMHAANYAVTHTETK